MLNVYLLTCLYNTLFWFHSQISCVSIKLRYYSRLQWVRAVSLFLFVCINKFQPKIKCCIEYNTVACEWLSYGTNYYWSIIKHSNWIQNSSTCSILESCKWKRFILWNSCKCVWAVFVCVARVSMRSMYFQGSFTARTCAHLSRTFRSNRQQQRQQQQWRRKRKQKQKLAGNHVNRHTPVPKFHVPTITITINRL